VEDDEVLVGRLPPRIRDPVAKRMAEVIQGYFVEYKLPLEIHRRSNYAQPRFRAFGAFVVLDELTH
jgi:hypothetical protein